MYKITLEDVSLEESGTKTDISRLQPRESLLQQILRKMNTFNQAKVVKSPLHSNIKRAWEIMISMRTPGPQREYINSELSKELYRGCVFTDAYIAHLIQIWTSHYESQSPGSDLQ